MTTKDLILSHLKAHDIRTAANFLTASQIVYRVDAKEGHANENYDGDKHRVIIFPRLCIRTWEFSDHDLIKTDDVRVVVDLNSFDLTI